MLNPQSYFDKHLLRLGRKLRDLQSRRYITVSLPVPIQRGWFRTHVMAEESNLRADREILRAILARIGTVQLRKTANFQQSQGKGKRRRLVDVEQPLRTIPAREWKADDFPAPWRPYFHVEIQRRWWRWEEVYVFNRPSFFGLKIEPNLIDTHTICDHLVQAEITQIENWLRHRGATFRMERLRDKTSDRSCDVRTREQILRKVISRETQNEQHGPEAESSAGTPCLPSSFQTRSSSRRSPTAEALRPERSQCGCKSCRRVSFNRSIVLGSNRRPRIRAGGDNVNTLHWTFPLRFSSLPALPLEPDPMAGRRSSHTRCGQTSAPPFHPPSHFSTRLGAVPGSERGCGLTASKRTG